MLTKKQIDELQKATETLTDDVVNFVIKDIIERVGAAGKITTQTAYDLYVLQNMGVGGAKIRERILKKLKITEEELTGLLTEYGEKSYLGDYLMLNSTPIPFSENKRMQQILRGIFEECMGEFENLTGTIGFVNVYGKFERLTTAYRTTSDYIFKQVATGARDYNSALTEATRYLRALGIQTIDYESGVRTEAGAALRRNIMSSVGNLTQQIAQQNHDDLGCDGWEISAHMACAADHEHIQGRRYTDSGFKKLNETLTRPIGTLNCGHIAYPVKLKESKPTHTESELNEYKEKNHEGIEINGKKYTQYEATQKMRMYERRIRKQQRIVSIDKQESILTNNTEKYNLEKIKLREQTKKYGEFCKKIGMKPQYSRIKNTYY